tara:strand:+ start:7412 stop:8518 length:1107 start_codon:yes stop_codon:yes gene_type:complete
MDDITYVFIKGRKESFEKKIYQARDFYYGCTSFDEENINLQIIEFYNEKEVKKFFLKLDYYLSKLFSLPLYFSRTFSFSNFRILKNSKKIVLVSESAGFSVLPMLLIIKLFKKPKVSLFVMGLYSKKIKYSNLKILHNLLIKLLISKVDNVFFLGKTELEIAKNMHKKINKLHYFPFCIDTEFWECDNYKFNFKDKKDIVFVGNDGNRDFELLKNIVKAMPEYNFQVITKHFDNENLDLNNVKIISGEWGNKNLKDSDLKKIYCSSRLTIIPLIESTQPSGQSVALQSISTGTPVLITKTKGFWDYDAYEDGKHIFFVDGNNTNAWIEKIKNTYNDLEVLEEVSSKSREKIRENFDIKHFNFLLNSLI